MTKRRTLIFIVYAPALVGNDGRTLAVVHGIERALPGVRLEWGVSEEGRPVALPQRDAWLSAATRRGEFPLRVQRRRELPRDGLGVWKTGAPQCGWPVTIRSPRGAATRCGRHCSGGGYAGRRGGRRKRVLGARVAGRRGVGDGETNSPLDGSAACPAPGPASAQPPAAHSLASDSPSPWVAELLVGSGCTSHRVPGPCPRCRLTLSGAAHCNGRVGRSAHGYAA